MTRMNDLLRSTIEEMTNDMPAAISDSLARDAMNKGGRIRRRRHLTVVVGVLVALAAIAAPVLFAPHVGGGPAASATPSPTSRIITEQPTPLAGGWLANQVGHWLLDRGRRSYVELPAVETGFMSRAPVGDRIVFANSAGGFDLTTVAASGKVTVGDPQLRGDLRWSPGGDRLVGVTTQKEPFRIGFDIVDAATGTLTKHWIDPAYDCSECTFGWSRDGREVVLAIADRSGGEAAELVARLQLFDAATGEPTRSLPVKAMPSSPFSWSPDGKYVIADADVLKGRPQLIDVNTGAATPFAYDAVWATNELLLASAGGTVLTLRRDGSIAEKATLGGAFAGLGTITLGPPD